MFDLVDKLKPDLIHTTGIRPDIFVAKFLKDYPHCITVRSYAYEDYTAKFGKIKGNIMAFQHIRTIKKSKVSVSCSYAISKKLSDRHRINSYVVQNGIDDTCFSQCDNKTKHQLRDKLGLPEDKKIFVFIGSLIELKNPLFLIKSFKEARISETATLVILGDGPLHEKCTDESDKSILVKGYVTNVIEYLRAADIFVSASKSEGLPNVVLEAMATGMPVILSDIDPHKEIIEKNIEAGQLFSIESIYNLSNILKQFVDSDLSSRSKASRQIVEDYFTSQIMSQHYQNLYNNLLGSK